MSSEQLPPESTKNSSCMSCFIVGLAMIGMAIVLVSIIGSELFDGWELPGFVDKTAAVGKTLDNLDLVPITATENPVRLADLSGKVVLVNFWATWCPPCRKELPEIAEIGERFGDNPDFLLLPVSSGDENLVQLSTDTMLLLHDMHLEMPCYADPSGATRQAYAAAAQVRSLSLPTTLVLDRKGVIRGVWIGAGKGKEIQALILKLLEEN